MQQLAGLEQIKYPPDYLSGLRLQYNSSGSVSVLTGEAMTASGLLYVVSNPITQSGLSLSASTWYHVYLVNGTSIELSTTAPLTYWGVAKQKTGDPSRRYMGSVRTDGGGWIYNFVHYLDDRVIYLVQTDASPFRVLSNAGATSETTVTISPVVPVTSRKASIHVTNTNASFLAVFGNSIDSVTLPGGYIIGVGNGRDAYLEMPTDSTPAFTYAMQGAGSGLYLDVFGYQFER